jgi:2-iminobutanoate/2-iminopropanoate deaminase
LSFEINISNTMADKQIIHAADAPAPIGPYSQAVKIDRFLYVSGQIALDHEGNLHTADIETEAHQVMKNLGRILKQADMSYSNIVKTTIFLKDMNDFQKVNQIYGSYFEGNYPARETVEVSRLPKDVSLEISIVAYH